MAPTTATQTPILYQLRPRRNNAAYTSVLNRIGGIMVTRRNCIGLGRRSAAADQFPIGLWLSAGIVSGLGAAFSVTPRFIEVWSLGHSIPAPSVRKAMFIARIGRNIRPPLGGPCPSAFQADNKAASISENTWTSYGGPGVSPFSSALRRRVMFVARVVGCSAVRRRAICSLKWRRPLLFA